MHVSLVRRAWQVRKRCHLSTPVAVEVLLPRVEPVVVRDLLTELGYRLAVTCVC